MSELCRGRCETGHATSVCVRAARGLAGVGRIRLVFRTGRHDRDTLLSSGCQALVLGRRSFHRIAANERPVRRHCPQVLGYHRNANIVRRPPDAGVVGRQRALDLSTRVEQTARGGCKRTTRERCTAAASGRKREGCEPGRLNRWCRQARRQVPNRGFRPHVQVTARTKRTDKSKLGGHRSTLITGVYRNCAPHEDLPKGR